MELGQEILGRGIWVMNYVCPQEMNSCDMLQIPAGCGSQALQNIALQMTLLVPVPLEAL